MSREAENAQTTAALKVYVDVHALLSKEGDLIPKSFVWEDGRTYEIDRIKKKEMQANRKAGGTGIMYTIIVDGKECHLYYKVDRFTVKESSGQPINGTL